MWKLRHWLHSSLPDSFFLSFFFFPSLVLLSLSLASRSSALRRVLLFSLSSHFSFPHYLVSALGNIVALCPRSSLFLPRLPLRPSTLNEGSFFTGTENSPTSKARAVLTFFRTYAFFLSLSLSSRKTSLSFHPLLFVCGFSPPRLGAVFLAAPYLSQLILSFGLFINWLILKKNLEFFYWIINWIKVLYTKLYW